MVLEVVTVNVNRFVRPFIRQTELAPRANVFLRAARKRRIPGQPLPTAGALRAEDSIQLIEGQLGYRIVFVDKDPQRKGPAPHVE